MQQVRDIARGGYVLADGKGVPDVIVIATGTEVGLAMDAARAIGDRANVRVVSMPSTGVFDRQDAAYRESVLPAAVTRRIAVEAGVAEGWWRYVGTQGKVLSVEAFGESAPASDVYEHFGLTADKLAQTIEQML